MSPSRVGTDFPGAASIKLFWLPLGAGGKSVRWNGRVFEAIAARFEGRDACDLYHSALEVCLGAERYVIEMAPAWSTKRRNRGVVSTGPVGLTWLGGSILFRYEIRRWRDGDIPDIAEAIGPPQVVGRDPARARRLLDLVAQVPTLVWGRDQLDIGDMWNSNSVISWLLARTDHDVDHIHPPAGGRAPGWTAGVVVARRAGLSRQT
jgi:hypothetical protein